MFQTHGKLIPDAIRIAVAAGEEPHPPLRMEAKSESAAERTQQNQNHNQFCNGCVLANLAKSHKIWKDGG